MVEQRISSQYQLFWFGIQQSHWQAHGLLTAHMAGSSWWDLAEAGLWVVLSAFLAFFGNGEHDIITLLWASPHINRLPRDIWVACLGLNVALFLYLYVGLGLVGRCTDVYAMAPWAAPIGAGSMVAGGIAFAAAVWPTFGLVSLVLVVIYAFGLLMSLHFLPLGVGPLALPRRHRQLDSSLIEAAEPTAAAAATAEATCSPAAQAHTPAEEQRTQRHAHKVGTKSITAAGVVLQDEAPGEPLRRPRREKA